MRIQSRRGPGFRFVAAVVTLILVATACGDDDSAAGDGDDAARELRSVSIPISTCSPYYYGYFTAVELGFFEEEGFDVSLECTGGSSEVATILAAGSTDFGAGSFSAFLPAMSQGIELHPFFVHTYGEPYEILVPPDSPITEIAELAGTTIGVSELAGGEMPLVRAVLTDAGLDPDTDVQYLEVGVNPAIVGVALENDEIAAYAGATQDVATYPAAGLELRSILPDFVGEIAAGGLLVGADNAGDLDMLAGLGRAVAKGQFIAFVNPRATECVLIDVMPEEFEDREIGRSSLEGSLVVTTPPQGDDGNYIFAAGVANEQAWKNFIDIYAAGGVIDAPFDVSPLLIDVQDRINDFDRDELTAYAESLPDDC